MPSTEYLDLAEGDIDVEPLPVEQLRREPAYSHMVAAIDVMDDEVQKAKAIRDLQQCNIRDQRRVRIVRNAVEAGSEFHVGTPKSGKKRTALLPGFLADELKDFCVEKSHASLVFEAPRRGEFILRPKPKGRSEGGTGGSWWAVAKEEAEVPSQMRIHDISHTAVWLAGQSGAP